MFDKEENSKSRKNNKLHLFNCFTTDLQFEEEHFKVNYSEYRITIERDKKNYAIITLKNQHVPYKINVLGGFALSEQKNGNVNYQKYFNIKWDDEDAMPELVFNQKPSKISREYEKGEKIELEIGDVTRYHIIYSDKVTANFTRVKEGMYEFSFSTGFSGSIKKDPDGTHSIKFQGIPVDPEDDHRSESKFIVSRSRYTNNLLLILTDKATVIMDH